MHIPDGYLSPSTCAGLFAGAAPFWYVALRRARHQLNTRMAPLLALFAAFSFVVMMFNLPLPGGTTGHAVGAGIAAIILGPSASILAISCALTIQAVFFGDGGITAIGANCFNMAIVGSLVAYGVYRLLAHGAGIGSRRRVIAAGLAGYAAINVAALCAAIEFGIQPLLFRDASGAPLYCPYPLSVSIPAMMLGHLTIAGLAEFIISAGLVAYLQRTDEGLLSGAGSFSPLTARSLWIGLAILLALTPLGILAAGGAWGEWSPQQLAHAPAGLERLYTLWTAPFAGYAPQFVPRPGFAYLLSAVLGVALIAAFGLLLRWLVAGRGRRRRSFVEKTILGLTAAVEQALFADEFARSEGSLQRLDARVKLAGLGALILAAVAVHQIWTLACIFVVAVFFALLSRIPLRVLAMRVWLAVLGFTGLIAVPAIFITPHGLHSAAMLVLRAETAATLSVLLVLSTPWTHLLKALRFFHVPVVLVVILGMTYRYVFLFLQIARDMFESRESRLIGVLAPADSRRLVAGSVGVLMEKTLQLSGEVHTAMQARGFRGEIHILDDLRMQRSDAIPLAAFLSIAGLMVWLGR